jgi:hypothetical protein
MDRVTAMGTALSPWRAITASRISDGTFLAPIWHDTKALRSRDTKAAVPAAHRIVATLQEILPLLALRGRISAMLSAPSDYDRTMLLVAGMVDAFPNARVPDLEVFLATTAMDIADAGPGHGFEVVARGLQLARAVTRFVPVISEILHGCAKAREEARLALELIDMLETASERAHRLIAKAGGAYEGKPTSAIDDA